MPDSFYVKVPRGETMDSQQIEDAARAAGLESYAIVEIGMHDADNDYLLVEETAP